MADIKTLLESYQSTFFAELKALNTQQELEAFRVAHLSRQGSLSQLMHQLKNFSLEEKKSWAHFLMT